MAVEYRAPKTKAEADDAIRCTVEAFGGNEEFFTNIVKEDPYYRDENTRACFVDGEVVSVVQIFERPMRIGSCIVKAACIGSVGTPPPHRRKGYSVGVLHDTAKYVLDDGYDISLLFTGVRGHYAKGGWVIYPTRFFQVEIPDALPEPSGGIDVELFDATRDLDDVKWIYTVENGQRTGSFERTDVYWDRRPRWRHQAEDSFFVARRDGKVAAYGCGRDGAVREAGALPGEDHALEAILVRILGLAREAGRDRTRANLPKEFGPVLERIGCKIRRSENPNSMARLGDLSGILRKVTPLLEDRLRDAGISDLSPVQLRTEMASAVVGMKDGVTSVEADGKGVEVALSQEQMIGLLVGGLTIDHVVAANMLSLDDASAKALRAMFPPDELHHWEWDGY